MEVETIVERNSLLDRDIQVCRAVWENGDDEIWETACLPVTLLTRRFHLLPTT